MNFLIKHKRKIIFWTILLYIVFYFAPIQSDYYLDKDVSNFKRIYLQPTLIWTGFILCIGILFYCINKIENKRGILIPFLFLTLTIATLLLIFENIFLAGTLYINRQYKRDSIQKYYVANFLAGTEQTKDNFFPFDLADNKIQSDRKLKNKLYKIGLKQNDTITIIFEKGLLGIDFQSEKLDDK